MLSACDNSFKIPLEVWGFPQGRSLYLYEVNLSPVSNILSRPLHRSDAGSVQYDQIEVSRRVRQFQPPHSFLSTRFTATRQTYVHAGVIL